MTEAYPLAWPEGWPRSGPPKPSGRGNFMRRDRKPWSFGAARDELLAELKRFGAVDVVLSSNFPLNREGRATDAKGRPQDQGVAVYFKRRGEPMCMAMDEWLDAESNMRSLALAIDALRQLERHGGGTVAKKAFTGFAALPPPKSWWQILGVSPVATRAEVQAAWRSLVADHHPDRGGDHARIAEINAARDEGLGVIEVREAK